MRVTIRLYVLWIFWSEKYSLQTGIFLDFINKLDVTIMIEWEENNMNFIKIDRVGIRINTIQILFVNFEVKHTWRINLFCCFVVCFNETLSKLILKSRKLIIFLSQQKSEIFISNKLELEDLYGKHVQCDTRFVMFEYNPLTLSYHHLHSVVFTPVQLQ